LEENREAHKLLVTYMRGGLFEDLKEEGKIQVNPLRGTYIRIVREHLEPKERSKSPN